MGAAPIRHGSARAPAEQIFATGGATGAGGHPTRLRESLLEEDAYEAFTKETVKDHPLGRDPARRSHDEAAIATALIRTPQSRLLPLSRSRAILNPHTNAIGLKGGAP